MFQFKDVSISFNDQNILSNFNLKINEGDKVLIYGESGIGKSTIIAVARMMIQLFLAGLYLNYLFLWDNNYLNIAWLIVMLLAATLSVLNNTDLNIKRYFIPVFISFLIANVLIVLYVNKFVINLENLLQVKYLVVIGGMLLGNSLRGIIVGISSFYDSIKRNEKRYLYHLSLGATHFETLKPYLSKSLIMALRPNMASMMTMGIVALPGMMTGQLLSGADPMIAIKYQIVIVIAIFASISLSVALVLLFTIRTSFNSYGILKNI